jgi:hypothetical protein
MHSKQLTSEKGQALVFIVLAMVALLGFTAVAVDGSMLYSDRRFAQNASDSASLSGASAAALSLENSGITDSNWDCDSNDIADAAAKARAKTVSAANNNGIAIDQDITDKHGVTTRCGIDTSQGFVDKYLDIHTYITFQTETSFLYFIYQGPVVNTVETIVRVRPRSVLAHGYAIVALNPSDCQGMNTGVEFHGTANSYVYEGGIFSNGCMRGVGTQNSTIYGGSAHYGKEFINTGGSVITPAPSKVNSQISAADYAIPAPDCSRGYLIDAKDLGKTISRLEPPGLYCVDGDAIINAHDELTGDGVTVVMLNGRLQIDGDATVYLTAPAAYPDPSPAIPGVVIYAPPETNYRDINKNGIHITGNSDSYFSGTILAPALDVYMNGISRNEAYKTQIIGWNVQIGGTSMVSVLFNENLLYTRPTLIDLYR